MPRSAEDIVRACHAQGQFLAASRSAYDAGDKWEALRLATVVHTLVYDGGKEHSLLSQLGVKHEITWMSSVNSVPGDLAEITDRWSPLIEYERYRDRKKYPDRIPEWLPLSTFLAMRGQRAFLRELPFEDWWESDVIFFDRSDGATLTRKKLVAALRNQEGGSHYDREVRDPNYLPLRQKVYMVTLNYGFGWSIGLELATMRQIAEELIISLQIHDWLRNLRTRSAKS